jgi:hypothetical protein
MTTLNAPLQQPMRMTADAGAGVAGQCDEVTRGNPTAAHEVRPVEPSAQLEKWKLGTCLVATAAFAAIIVLAVVAQQLYDDGGLAPRGWCDAAPCGPHGGCYRAGQAHTLGIRRDSPQCVCEAGWDSQYCSSFLHSEGPPHCAMQNRGAGPLPTDDPCQPTGCDPVPEGAGARAADSRRRASSVLPCAEGGFHGWGPSGAPDTWGATCVADGASYKCHCSDKGENGGIIHPLGKHCATAFIISGTTNVSLSGVYSSSLFDNDTKRNCSGGPVYQLMRERDAESAPVLYVARRRNDGTRRNPAYEPEGTWAIGPSERATDCADSTEAQTYVSAAYYVSGASSAQWCGKCPPDYNGRFTSCRPGEIASPDSEGCSIWREWPPGKNGTECDVDGDPCHAIVPWLKVDAALATAPQPIAAV